MKLSVENLKKPTHRKWKLIADYLLYTALPAVNIFFVAMQPVDKEFTIWGMAISNLFIMLFKGASKFSTDEK